MSEQKILIAGQWQNANSTGNIQAVNPANGEKVGEIFPVSGWVDIDLALDAAAKASAELRGVSGEKMATFLETYAIGIEAHADQLCEIASLETGLPAATRLGGIELPRTTNQLRLAAKAAREGSWTLPTIDTAVNIRSCHGQLGPVCVMGPNNFPFAFSAISGGDFAAAIAGGNPVIAKAHPSQPGTTKLFAEIALKALKETGLPLSTVQLIYDMSREDGLKLVSDGRIAATGFTGSMQGGLALKAAADKAGKLIYLELSSINPVVLLPGVMTERGDDLATEFAGSCLMASGQFCTNPGLVLLCKNDETETFIKQVSEKFEAAAVGTLLNKGVENGLIAGIKLCRKAGAELLVGDTKDEAGRYCYGNTLLRVSGSDFLGNSEALQVEMFGNASLIVVADDESQIAEIIDTLQGNLTGCIYSDSKGDDDQAYDLIAPILRSKVGRLINDKMPTGVAVSPAMNHGGPYPSSGHPGFSAVGLPGAIRRFSALHCYDNVRQNRLPAVLRDENPCSTLYRLIDGQWTTQNISQPVSV